nr:larval cuticle protein A2B-like [Cherax quadricarinatus]
MSSKVLLCVVVVVVAGDTRPLYDYAAPQDSVEYSPRSREVKYDFGYAVRDDFDNDFGHQESRNGDDTKGSYSVHLPDGRLQTVTYYVDGDSGYVAEVTYQGEARYPESHEVRSYVPPRPLYRAPDSDESNEPPVYNPPSRSYGFP